MKQVTMESVKQRIADLESAGIVVGGLSLSSEFELACLRELVAVTENVRAVTEQRDAVVAESAIARDRHRFIRALAVSILEHSGGRRDWRGAMEDASELIKTVDGVYSQFPVTDAAIAALRAEGVEMFADMTEKVGKEEELYDNGESALMLKYTAKQARLFARQLRESKGEVSNG